MSALKNSISLNYTIRPFKCSYCSKSFKKRQQLNSHENRHTGLRPYKCDKCPQAFSSHTHLTHHKNRHLGIKPYVCSICDKSFVRQSELTIHKNQHTGKKPFKCKICKKSFTQDPHLKAHLRTHSGDKPYSCDICPKKFSQSSHLKVHKLLHSGEKRYQCKVCKVKFNLPHHLKSHLRTHSGERPYKCPHCPSAFTQSSPLSEHIKKWHGNEKLPCRVCGKVLKTEQQRKTHEKSHFKEFNFECVFCERKFWKRVELWTHIRSHVKEKPFECRVCKKYFMTQTGRRFCEKEHNKKAVNGAMESVELQVNSPTASHKDLSPESPQLDINVPIRECKVCGMKMKSHYQLNSHMRIHIRDGSVLAKGGNKQSMKSKQRRCTICNQLFGNRFQMNSHMRVHKVKIEDSHVTEMEAGSQEVQPAEELALSPSLRCRQERKDYHSLHHGPAYRISNESRSRSRSTEINEDTDDAVTIDMNMRGGDGDKSFKRYQCRICKLVCKHKNHLNGHMHSHKAKKLNLSLVKQENVAVGFFSVSPSKEPRLVHDGPLFFTRNMFFGKVVKVKPFKCNKCPFSAVEGGLLALHNRLVHEGVTPQKCGQCWKSFPTLARLEEHSARDHSAQNTDADANI